MPGVTAPSTVPGVTAPSTVASGQLATPASAAGRETIGTGGVTWRSTGSVGVGMAGSVGPAGAGTADWSAGAPAGVAPG
ncbi:hypothetical protein [Micromonospora sp. NPDC048887]|uniref:hypothetical protein n=1 Tax=unclassified Micromonospora TaxID=2617518 RepID=UPI0033E7D209